MRARRCLDWLVTDLLRYARARVRRDLLVQFRHDVLVWALLAPHQKKPGKPPAVPALLRASD